jgi:predicted AAA+ superfamily ATPase
LEEEARFRGYEDAFFWLKDSGIITPCYNTTEPSVGLKMNKERTTMKCFMADTGLLISHAFDERGIVTNDVYQKILLSKLDINEGMLMENIVAQMFTAKGHNLYFYSKNSENAQDRMEIDFLLAKSRITSRHNIIPVEVKSTSHYSHVSIDKFRKKFSDFLGTPIVFHPGELKLEDNILYLPLCMAAVV